MSSFLTRPSASVKKKLRRVFRPSSRNRSDNPGPSSSAYTGVSVESTSATTLSRAESTSAGNTTVSTPEPVQRSTQPEPSASTPTRTSRDPTGGNTGHSTTSGRHPDSQGSTPWLNGVKLALALFEKTLDSVPVPGLKGAVGGVVKIIEQYDKASQNRGDLEELKESVEKLNALFACYVGPSPLPMPAGLSNRIQTVSNELEDVQLQIEQGLTHGLFRRIVDASDDAQLVVELLRKIKNSIDKLTVVSVVQTEAIAWVVLKDAERALLGTLPRAKAARWDYVKIDECLEGTRGTVLKEIKARIFNDTHRRIQWLNGLAGTGKSTLSKSVAHSFADESQLGASFFCSRDETDRSNVGLIFPTLAFQLSETVLGFSAELIKVLRSKPDIGHALPPVQLQKLIVDPLRTMGSHSQAILIVIDALDECKDEKAPSTILMALTQCIDMIPFLKVFVTSRPEEDMRQTFRSMPGEGNVLDLHLVDKHLVDNDIRLFLTVRLTAMTEGCSTDDLPAHWPPPELVDRLVTKAAGLFIFASTLCKAIRPRGNLDEQIKKLAKLSTNKEGRLGIDDLYRTVFESALADLLDEEVSECCTILATIILLQDPLSITDLSKLLCRPRSEVDGYLTKFHSVLDIPREDRTRPVRIIIIHASFHDFLTDETRCSGKLLVRPALQHQEITMFLFKHLMDGLHEDTDEIGNIYRQQSIDGVLSYACRFWADHLACTPEVGNGAVMLVAALDRFVRTRCARWTATLFVLGRMHISVIALRKTIRWHSDVVEPQPALVEWLQTHLARVLCHHFSQTGEYDSLDQAILLNRNVLELRPIHHRDRLGTLNDLARALSMRFQNSGQLEDLEETILLLREAFELNPTSRLDRSTSLDNLGSVLRIQFEQSGQHGKLEQSISLHRQALKLLPATHSYRSGILRNLASALSIQFQQSGQCEELDEAVSASRKGLSLQPLPHPDRSDALNNLGGMLQMRFGHLGQYEDLDEAISLHQEALNLQPVGYPNRSSYIDNLACALRARFGQSGQHNDLDEAIYLHREALELQPATHPNRSSYIDHLACALRAQFDQLGQREDLDEAILLHRDALELQPATRPSRPSCIDNLACALMARFDQLCQHEDLDEAILLHRDALELQPATRPSRPSCIDNLACALRARFDQLGQHEDLDEAILLHRAALELQPTPHPDRACSLYNYANALATSFSQSGQYDGLDNAINIYRESLETLISGHPLVCKCSAALGRALTNAHSHTYLSEYLDNGMAAFQVAVTCTAASTLERFNAAKSWVHHAEHSNHVSVLDAYQAAIELLPGLAMLGLDVKSHQRALTSCGSGLAANAAACAIRSGQFERAVELLEEGRTVIWSQMLQLRTPLTCLGYVGPDLEKKLRHISIALERCSIWDRSDSSQNAISTEKESAYFRRLNNERLVIIEEVRQLDGFEDFLRPRRVSTLQYAASNGPVVVLNASINGCAALILTGHSVQYAPLPHMTLVLANGLVRLLKNATLSESQNASLLQSNLAVVEGLVPNEPLLSGPLQLLKQSLKGTRVSDISTQSDIFRYILGVLWLSIVEPVIHALNLKKSDVPQRLWWCPTGPIAFLPIHAAGLYLCERTESVSDYAVSSYTPNISALLGEICSPTDSFCMAAVVQPETAGNLSIPGILAELRTIEVHVPGKHLVTLVGGSVDKVISHLAAASMVHFACCGEQDINNPLESHLALKDGSRLTISRIIQQFLPNSSLAFLSAPETAMGDENLPDEVLHLGAAFLFTGFHGVVATMWGPGDSDCPKIADAFYGYLFKNSSTATGPDTTQAARALHVAVDKLRSEGAPFVRWVPFIHLGR